MTKSIIFILIVGNLISIEGTPTLNSPVEGLGSYPLWRFNKYSGLVLRPVPLGLDIGMGIPPPPPVYPSGGLPSPARYPPQNYGPQSPPYAPPTQSAYPPQVASPSQSAYPPQVVSPQGYVPQTPPSSSYTAPPSSSYTAPPTQQNPTAFPYTVNSYTPTQNTLSYDSSTSYASAGQSISQPFASPPASDMSLPASSSSGYAPPPPPQDLYSQTGQSGYTVTSSSYGTPSAPSYSQGSDSYSGAQPYVPTVSISFSSENGNYAGQNGYSSQPSSSYTPPVGNSYTQGQMSSYGQQLSQTQPNSYSYEQPSTMNFVPPCNPTAVPCTMQQQSSPMTGNYDNSYGATQMTYGGGYSSPSYNGGYGGQDGHVPPSTSYGIAEPTGYMSKRSSAPKEDAPQPTINDTRAKGQEEKSKLR